jgi:hypothetical protein
VCVCACAAEVNPQGPSPEIDLGESSSSYGGEHHGCSIKAHQKAVSPHALTNPISRHNTDTHRDSAPRSSHGRGTCDLMINRMNQSGRAVVVAVVQVFPPPSSLQPHKHPPTRPPAPHQPTTNPEKTQQAVAYYPPVDPALFGILSLVLGGAGLFVMAAFFVYEMNVRPFFLLRPSFRCYWLLFVIGGMGWDGWVGGFMCVQMSARISCVPAAAVVGVVVVGWDGWMGGCICVQMSARVCWRGYRETKRRCLPVCSILCKPNP